MKNIYITTEYIKLDQFLKLADITGSGGESRSFINNNKIIVNEEPENRRGKKIRNGDVIIINDVSYKIIQAGEKT